MKVKEIKIINFRLICQVMVCILVCVGCGKKEEVSAPKIPKARPVAPPAPVAAVEEPQEPEEKPVYLYSGDRFRDPFTTLGQTSSYQPNAIFNPEQAKVKAIIFGPRLRTAVIFLPTGGSYFIKKGTIFDIMGKTVKGFKARVLPEKVVITGETDDVYELKIRSSEEDQEEKT